VLVALLVADTGCCAAVATTTANGVASHLDNTTGSIGERIFPGDY